jgi:hypothetical protein
LNPRGARAMEPMLILILGVFAVMAGVLIYAQRHG